MIYFVYLINMIKSFYDNYTIDDADMDCNRVIISTCEWEHRYATICELIENCPAIKQLTRNCIITFLNDLEHQSKASGLNPEERFLRVGIDWCLEIASPCICNEDKYVIATEWDTDPGPLDTKVKGSCSYDWLYCIDIEEAGPQLLVWRPSGPNGPFINPDMPDCDDSYVKMKREKNEWKVYYECEPDNKPQFAYCLYTWGQANISCKEKTIRYYATHAGSPKPVYDWSKDNWESYLNGDWDISATEAFEAPDRYGVIKIVQPWIYEIAFSSYITFYQVCWAIRCGIYVDEYDGRWFHEINDIKYQWWETPWSGPTTAFNRMHPFAWDPAKWTRNYQRMANCLENTWLPFSRTYLFYVEKECELALCVKPDMQGLDVRVEADRDDRYFIKMQGTASWVFGAITSIEICRVSDAPHKSRYRTIKP